MATRGKRMSAKVQETVDRLLNGAKEPKYTALNSDQSTLLRGLNYYSIHTKPEMSKKWAIEWCKTNAPELVAGLKEKKEWRFSNRGFALRMVQNGFILEATQLKRIKDELTKLAAFSEPVVEEKKVVVKRKVVEPNKVFEEFDYAIDDILTGNAPRNVALGTDKKQQAEVLAQADKMLKEMEESPEYFDKAKSRAIKKFLVAFKKQVDTVVQVVKQQRVRKVAPKKINPIKMASGMSFKKKDEELGLESVRPEALIGAKQAIVYNTEYRQLMYFKAASDDGFMISGSTLKNYDLEKSIFKKVRKPEDMVKAVKGVTLATARKFLDTISSKAFPCKGRFNENALILKVSG